MSIKSWLSSVLQPRWRSIRSAPKVPRLEALEDRTVPAGAFVALPPSATTGFGPQLRDVVTADFNGDNIPDVAVVDYDRVLLMSGVGNGGFTPGPILTSGAPAGNIQVAAGKFNSDPFADLAILNQDTGQLRVFLTADAPLTAASPATPVATLADSCVLISGDVRGTGQIDLVASSTSQDGQGNITLFTNNGAGTFTPQAAVSTNSTFEASALALGHFVGGNFSGLAVANWADGTFSILLPNADGTNFAPGEAYQAPAAILYTIAAGSVRGNGLDDIAFADGVDQTFVYLNDGSGNFPAASAAINVVGSNPFKVLLSDFNGDGRDDLAVYQAGLNNVSVLQSTSNTAANFTPFSGDPQTFPAGGGDSHSIGDFAVGRFSGTDRLDILGALNNGNVQVLQNQLVSDGAAAVITIMKATPTMTVTGGTFPYNGKARPASAVVTGVGGATVSGDLTFTYNGSTTVPTKAGVYSVVATFTSTDSNYTGATGSATLTILSAKKQIGLIIDQVNALVGSRKLSRNNGNVLRTSLDNAINRLNLRNTTGAINELRMFILKVNGFNKLGKLTKAGAQRLIDPAEVAIRSV